MPKILWFIDEEMRQALGLRGFGNLLWVASMFPTRFIPWALFDALVERWSPLSHTLQLKGHEATILLEEVETFIGLDALSPDEAFIYKGCSNTSSEIIREISGWATNHVAKMMATGEHLLLLRNVYEYCMSLKKFFIPSDKTRYMCGVMIILGGLFLFPHR